MNKKFIFYEKMIKMVKSRNLSLTDHYLSPRVWGGIFLKVIYIIQDKELSSSISGPHILGKVDGVR